MTNDEVSLIYADESGNTGENLFDERDPIFTIAGVKIEDGQARDLVAQAASALGFQGKELKSKSLLRNPKARKVLYDVLEKVEPGSIFTFIADKQYMTTLKLVDLLIVENSAKNGYNMYADGSHKGTAALLHFLGPTLGDKRLWNALLRSFADFARRRGGTDPNVFTEALDRYIESLGRKVNEGPFPLLQAARMEVIPFWLDKKTGLYEDNLDPALPGIYAFCEKVGDRVGKFNLIHDHSKVIQRNIKKLTSNELPDPIDPTKFLPQLPLVGIEFADSATSDQIKIADWAAAAARLHAQCLMNPGVKSLDPKFSELVDSWLVWSIWPDLDFLRNMGKRQLETN